MQPEMDFFELIQKEEALHPDLKEYVTDLSSGLRMINHPLIQSIILNEKNCAWDNLQYDRNKKEAKRFWRNENIRRYVFLHVRPWRLNAFMKYLQEHHRQPSRRQFTYMVREIWIDTENAWQNAKQWNSLFNDAAIIPSELMDKYELKELNDLGDTFIVYRGYSQDNCLHGLSWTLDRDKAVWFARRYASKYNKSRVATGKVERKKVHAFFVSRGEREIVASSVEVLKIEEI